MSYNDGKIIHNIQITCHFQASQLNAYFLFNKIKWTVGTADVNELKSHLPELGVFR